VNRRRCIEALAAGAIALAVAAPGVRVAHADKQLIDRIVAVVDDEAIFQSDVETAMRQYMMQRGVTSVSPAQRDSLFHDALESLVNDRLVIAQAGRLNIDVPFEDVEAQVNKAIEENKKTIGGEEAFNRQLLAEGLTLDDLKKLYRTQLRNRMLVERVLQKDMTRDRPEVTDEQLEKFYEDNKSRFPKRPEVVHLKTIFIGFETASGAISASRQKAMDIRKRLIGGADFAEVAKKESDDASASLGGDLGWVKPQDLREPAFAAAVAKLDVGQISEPVLTVYGYHIIEVTEKRPETGEFHIRHILVRTSPSDSDIQQVYASASSIADDLKAGVSFDSLATRYNTDPAADKHGDLGWLRVGELPQFFKDTLAQMKPGEVSPVFRESSGFRIVKLMERDVERPYRFEEVKSDIKRLYDQQKFGETYDAYIAELRKKFPVDMRI
jgi:peptidyl-prolyl cis-trans isomerase SurA